MKKFWIFSTDKTYLTVTMLTVKFFHNHFKISRTQQINHIPNLKLNILFWNLKNKKIKVLNIFMMLILVKKLMMIIVDRLIKRNHTIKFLKTWSLRIIIQFWTLLRKKKKILLINLFQKYQSQTFKLKYQKSCH